MPAAARKPAADATPVQTPPQHVVAEKPKAGPIQRCPKGCLLLEYESSSPKGRGRWYANVPFNHTPDDVMAPTYFGVQHADKNFRIGDTVEIEPESGHWWLEARVMGSDETFQIVKLRLKSFQDYSVKPPSGYRFEWEGKDRKWCVYKGIKEVGAGFDLQEECVARAIELTHDRA